MTAEAPDEEPWESEIGAMFGRLPMVEPPPGFIDSVLAHRPLYAGRVTLGLFAVSFFALAGAVVAGVTGGAEIVPRVEDLAVRHQSAAEASGIGPIVADADGDAPVDMPPGFERTGDLTAEDIRQAVYARGDEAVSVFVQKGRVQWEALPTTGLTEIEGLQAWVDRERQVTVVETDGQVVTIVGLPTEEVDEVLDSLPGPRLSLFDHVQNTVSSLVGQFGYPNLGLSESAPGVG